MARIGKGTSSGLATLMQPTAANVGRQDAVPFADLQKMYGDEQARKIYSEQQNDGRTDFAAPDLQKFATAQQQAAPAPEVTAPAPPSYMDQYRASLAASRKTIQDQLGVALADIARNGGTLSSMVGALPGRYNDIYSGARANLQQGADTVAQAQRNSGLAQFANPGADMAPIQAGLDQAAASRQAGASDLALVVPAYIAAKRAEAQQNASNQLAALDAQDRQALLGFAQNEYQQQAAAKQAADQQLSQFATSEPAKGDPNWYAWAVQPGNTLGQRALQQYGNTFNDIQNRYYNGTSEPDVGSSTWNTYLANLDANAKNGSDWNPLNYVNAYIDTAQGKNLKPSYTSGHKKDWNYLLQQYANDPVARSYILYQMAAAQAAQPSAGG